MRSPLVVFGYGSLMYEPSCPELVVDEATAHLSGHTRAFHLRSTARGCSDAACDGEPIAGFLQGDLRLSLVLGTRPGRGLVGRVHRYRREHRDHVLAALRRREGDAYVHEVVEVEVGRTTVEAHTFLSRWDHPLSVDLELHEQARVLHAATPRVQGARALGAYYLLGVQAALEQMGQRDPVIDDLADRVRRLA